MCRERERCDIGSWKGLERNYRKVDRDLDEDMCFAENRSMWWSGKCIYEQRQSDDHMLVDSE